MLKFWKAGQSQGHKIKILKALSFIVQNNGQDWSFCVCRYGHTVSRWCRQGGMKIDENSSQWVKNINKKEN